jgi:hypothetical protein
MARFTSSTFGKISGKHGNAVAAVRKDGTCILKVYRIASNPNTLGQKSQRAKFGFVMKEINCLRKVFTYTYGSQYGISKAVSQSMKLAVNGDFPNFILDFSKVHISDRMLNEPIKFEMNKLNPQAIRITWDSNCCPPNLKSANVSLVLLQPESKEVSWEQNVVSLNSDFTELIIPAVWESKKLHIWLYISPSDNYLTIQSTYLGIIE